MTRLLLLRHGESVWNVEGRWQGWADPPLSAEGERQAVEAGRRLRPLGFIAVAGSDLQRARRTAELAGAAMGLSTGVRVDAGLREYDIGEWSGLTRAEIEARWPRALDEWRLERRAAPPGGERRDEFRARILAAVSRIEAAGRTGPVLVITHGGVIGELEQSLGTDRHRWDHLDGRWFEGSGGERRPGLAVCLSSPGPGPGPGPGAVSEVAVRDQPTAEGGGTELSSPGGSPTSLSCSRASYLPRW